MRSFCHSDSRQSNHHDQLEHLLQFLHFLTALFKTWLAEGHHPNLQLETAEMQFQGLSQSFGGASLPRDSHLVQAIAAQEGDEALENDELEERELRKAARQRRRDARKAATERQKARERQPSTLESFLEEPEERDHPRREEEALLSGESDDDASDEDELTHETSALDATSSSAVHAGPSKRKMSVKSAWSRRLSAAAPANQSGFASVIAGAASEFTPLLGVPSASNRKASISTLTPRPLQRLYKGGAPVSPARKVSVSALLGVILSC